MLQTIDANYVVDGSALPTKSFSILVPNIVSFGNALKFEVPPRIIVLCPFSTGIINYNLACAIFKRENVLPNTLQQEALGNLQLLIFHVTITNRKLNKTKRQC